MHNHNLSGNWNFKIDRERVGIREKWFLDSFSETIRLPGTMEENGCGDTVSPTKNSLSHTLQYYGWAWYQTQINISEFEAAQCIKLILSKVPRDSFVWVDGKYYGTHNNLCTPHEYDLTGLNAGKHMLVVMVDNSNQRSDDFAPLSEEASGKDYLGQDISLHLHTKSDSRAKVGCSGHGKSCFNGIVGDILLTFKPKLHIMHTNVTPDLRKNSVHVDLSLWNTECICDEVEVSVSCDGNAVYKTVRLNGEPLQKVSLELSFAGKIQAWDEFRPVRYTFYAQCRKGQSMDHDIVTCGLRELTTDQHHIYINGSRLFMRATLEGDAYPLTGYEPADEEFWTRAFLILKEYGLNGMRMHTFIPPKEAFEAAEKVGFYLHIELPGTSCPTVEETNEISDFLWSELKRSLELYGNYACFVFMAMGNEQFVMGDKDLLIKHQNHVMEKVAYAQKTDPRHLYSCAAHPYTPDRNDDIFFVATKDSHVLNGIRWGGPDPITTSRFNTMRPSTAVNYEEGIMSIERPSITHEVGQWAVYPNFAEMSKYTGVLRPENYKMFADELEENGILHQNSGFVYNSGMLSAILYKEEIESALRTPDLSGFELLDIHDYPGQGTSTVGILDCFFDSKGLVSSEDFRKCCSSVVPLCSFDRFVYRSGEDIVISPMIANYSRDSIYDNMSLAFSDKSGNIISAAEFAGSAPCGQLTEFQAVKFRLETDNAEKLTLSFTVGSGKYQNDWSIWVYPSELPEIADSVEIVTELDGAAYEMLSQGKNVLLLYPHGTHPINGNNGSFTCQFWNPFMKPQEALNGIMCDPSHPIFRDFPTDSHTNYQWWEILMKSYPFRLDKMPLDYFPIVQVIPGIKENKKFGLIWECKTVSGKLLVCTADLRDNDNRPAAKQLLYSIVRYMQSDDFAPQREISFDLLKETLK